MVQRCAGEKSTPCLSRCDQLFAGERSQRPVTARIAGAERQGALEAMTLVSSILAISLTAFGGSKQVDAWYR